MNRIIIFSLTSIQSIWMRLLFVILLVLSVTCNANAQNLSIKNFYLNENDLTANSRNTEVYDQNGDKCALIRIQTTTKGFIFDVGSAGIQKVDDNHTGEIWVYVPYGIKHIDIRHSAYGSLLGYNFPVSIVKGRTYILELSVNTNNNNSTKQDIRVSMDNSQTKKTLFSMKKNEVLYCSAYLANLNIGDDRFACVLKDTITNKMTFVWNGERKINNVFFIWASHIDLSDYNKCIIYYAEKDEYYTTAFIEGKTFGPYDGWMYFFSENHGGAEYKGPGMLGTDMPYRSGWMFKDYFVFNNMGIDYLYSRGKITKVPDKYRHYDSESHEQYTAVGEIAEEIQKGGLSPNGKYKAVYLNGKLSVNNKVYKTYNITDAKQDSTSYHYWGELFATDEGKVFASLPQGEVLIDCKTGKVTDITEGKTFDYQHFSIIDEPKDWDRVFERKDASINYDVERLAISLQDETLQHTFLSTLKASYVLIDNKKIGNGAALSAKYDSQKKAFIWMAFEGLDLVVYEYKL